MEQRIRSLQNASTLNCETCSLVLKRLKLLEDQLQNCESKKQDILRHTSHAIQDILEEAISGKDSKIAEYEMKGVLDENETKACDALKSERDRLLHRLRIENEWLVDSQRDIPLEASQDVSLPDLTLADGQIAVCEDAIVWVS
ncbi:hypothetical protein RR48_02824 [Papilio machaon]|uniref:Uncharacterized protein n=1 Tax=Papilio machaon TaxID=76193 RepID=A0A0N1PHY4_PAPMA|nr:hypothetical protein RR48_02824 [Papilio machaon]